MMTIIYNFTIIVSEKIYFSEHGYILIYTREQSAPSPDDCWFQQSKRRFESLKA